MNLMNLMRIKLNEQKGQGMVEYALLVALIAIVVIAALLLLGPAIGNIFNNITTKL
ncbi:Flp family type IVb pilin [Fusibacter sp. A1]|nr:Flp family type IVb pilin [Fusibacter sp. A1]RXV61153.1 Flp family type IVb pilin [Fusibacter sp. A1]